MHSFFSMYHTILLFIKFKTVRGAWCLNGPRGLFPLFCCITLHIFDPCVYINLALTWVNTVPT